MIRPVLVALVVTSSASPGAGEVRGTVRYTGPVPAAPALEVTKDRPVCGASQPDESLLVSGGGLANVVVRVDVPGARAAPRTVALDQQGCRYVPHVLAAPVGSTLELRSADPILHSVHGYLGKATAIDVPIPYQGRTVQKPLPRPGAIRVVCDIHDWMSAWVVVTETPFVAVTDAAGRFTIPGVPAGTWDAVVWHERLGERRAKVTVPAGGAATLDVAYP
jgi:plastocyanin